MSIPSPAERPDLYDGYDNKMASEKLSNEARKQMEGLFIFGKGRRPRRPTAAKMAAE